MQTDTFCVTDDGRAGRMACWGRHSLWSHDSGWRGGHPRNNTTGGLGSREKHSRRQQQAAGEGAGWPCLRASTDKTGALTLIGTLV